MTHEKQLKNPKYRSWVKTGLGLKYLKEGLEQFTVDITDEQHQAILMRVRKSSKAMYPQCNQCQINIIMPNHVRTKSNHCPWGVNDCNCRQPRGKQTCPNGICGDIYEQIIQLHGSTPPAPYWRNTDVTLWCSNPWEIAKCFINAPGYAHTTSAHGTDCAGLLHIIVNNLGFQSHISCDITGTDIFSKTRQYRNEILHSATMELEDHIANHYIDDMIAVLQDPKELCTRPESANAVQKLIELKSKDFVITTDNEMEIVQEMQNTLTKETDKSIEIIRSYALDKTKEMETKKVDVDNEVLKSKTDAINEMHNALNKHSNDLETKAAELNRVLEDSAKAQETRITKIFEDITVDLNKSKLEAVKYLENAQKDLLSKHLKELDTKAEEMNLQLFSKEERVSNEIAEIGAKQIHVAKSMSKQNMSPATYDMKADDNKQETACLTNASALVQNPSDYDIGKQEFKKRLIDLYMETIVKESVLPLHPEMNEATIDQLYVTPSMKLEASNLKNKTSHKWATQNIPARNIQSFYDILYKDGKRLKLIYIIGEAGSGKSAFCKNMIYKWCLSHFQAKANDAILSERKNKTTEEELTDDEVLKSYDFLFYISLRHNTDTGHIQAMLNNHYGDALLDAVLEEDSEKCLILIDGLDEWKPPEDTNMSQTQTSGLPRRDLDKKYAVITTSRPWKFEVLKIKESEIDSKIRLCGIEYKSMIKMASYTVSHLNKYFEKKKSVNRFLAKYVLSNGQNKTPLSDILSSPVMLKQLVCLWFEDKLCHSLRWQIYCSMLELSLEWSVQRKPDDKIFETFREQSLDSEEVNLPETFDEDSVCNEYKSVISRSSKIAYKALFSEQKETSLTFSYAALRKYGETKEFIQCCLEMGILTEVQNVTFSLTKRRNNQLSFTHKSIQEVLAAINIVIECNTPENDKMDNVFKYFKNVKSVEDVLEQSYVIEIICGLDPTLATYVSRYIYDIVLSDKRCIEYRKNLTRWYDCSILSQIQEVIFECIKELQCIKGIKCDNLYLADVILRQKSDIPHLNYIKPSSIMSVTIAGEIWGLSRSSIHLGENGVEIICNIIRNCSQSMRRFSKIDSITADAGEELPIYYELVSSACCHLEVFELRSIRLSHGNLCRLTSLIEKNTKLLEILLKDIYCDDDSCKIHNIDLSNLAMLRNIDISSSDFKLQNLNVQNLVICSLTEMNGCINIGHLLSGAQSLQYLNLASCTCPFDGQELSNVPKLKHVDLSDIQMNETSWQFFISSLKTCPEIESISLTSLRLTDRVKMSLLSDIQEISQIKSLCLRNTNGFLQFTSDFRNLKNLVFDNVKCFQTSTFDFIKSLQYLCNIESIAFQNMNFPNSSLLPPSDTMGLKHILLQNVNLEKEGWMEFGHSLKNLDLLKTLQFQDLNVPDNALEFSSNMQHLKSISFEKVMVSLVTWKDIADSLCKLPQTVEVHTVDLYIERGSLETAIDYVKKRSDLFQVFLSFGVDCSYKTIKDKSS